MQLILLDDFWLVSFGSKVKFLRNSQWITFPTLSCLVLYSFRYLFIYLFSEWSYQL